MSAEKGETKKKKGLTWAEAAKQVTAMDAQRRSPQLTAKLYEVLSVEAPLTK